MATIADMKVEMLELLRLNRPSPFVMGTPRVGSSVNGKEGVMNTGKEDTNGEQGECSM